MSRVRSEAGYTLTELLAAMAILLIVLSGLTTLFVSAMKAETDLDRRFQAQQNARLALAKIRREAHCASDATTTGDAVTLTLGPYCSAGTGDVTWCSVAVSSGRYALYRQVGTTCDGTGTRVADYLTQASLFAYTAPSSAKLATLDVAFPIDLDPDDGRRGYRLVDSIALRNSTRA
jgi:prepilin-type N-terminal cleavage/methylation domain-containing protein